jgi:hypothetical protein
VRLTRWRDDSECGWALPSVCEVRAAPSQGGNRRPPTESLAAPEPLPSERPDRGRGPLRLRAREQGAAPGWQTLEAQPLPPESEHGMGPIPLLRTQPGQVLRLRRRGALVVVDDGQIEIRSNSGSRIRCRPTFASALSFAALWAGGDRPSQGSSPAVDPGTSPLNPSDRSPGRPVPRKCRAGEPRLSAESQRRGFVRAGRQDSEGRPVAGLGERRSAVVAPCLAHPSSMVIAAVSGEQPSRSPDGHDASYVVSARAGRRTGPIQRRQPRRRWTEEV